MTQAAPQLAAASTALNPFFLNTPPLSPPLPPHPLPPPLCSAFDPTGTRSLCIPVIPAAANNQLSVIY